MMIERVEVVTGGVSIGWGSDAVAGVINFASLDFSGVDFEVSDRQALSNWFAGTKGDLSFSLMGTRTIDIIACGSRRIF